MDTSETQTAPVVVASSGFIEREPYEKGFTDFFEKNVKDKLLKAEQERIVLHGKFRRHVLWGYPMYIPTILLAGFMVVNFEDPRVGIVVGLLLGGILYRWINAPVNEYHSKVKEGIVAEVVKFFGNLTFSESKKIDEQILKDSAIAASYSTYYGGDDISGNFNGVDMEMCEAHLKQRGKNSEYTVFKGEMFNIKLKKTFTGKTIVKKDAGMLGNAFLGMFSKLERIKLEDPKFESEFEVYGSDQVESRYLLTTAFMERLLALRDSFDKNGTVQCVFQNGYLFITISTTRDLFEAGPIDKSCLDTEDIHTFLAQMESVFQIIEVLKLNKYTGL